MAKPPNAATGRRPRWFGTLKVRLMLAATLVIAASVALSTLVVLERVERRTEQAVMDLERDNVERMASLLMQRVVGMQKMLRATAAVLPPAARSDSAAAIEFLRGEPALMVSFATIFLTDEAGQLLALNDGVTTTQQPMNLSSREYFGDTLAQGVPIVSAPLGGRFSNEPIIQLTMPVPGPDGHVAAVLGGTLRLGTRNLFDDLTYAGSSGDDNVVTIVTDARGTIISHPQHDHVMRSIEAEAGLADVAARWIAQGRPVEPSGFASHEQGWFVSIAGVPGADWMVFRMTRDEQLLGGLAQARREAMQWAGGVALGGGLLILALLAVLLGPLSRLRERALALQGGVLPIGDGWPQAHGEIGELSRVLQQVLRDRAQHEQTTQVLVQQMGSVLAAAPIGIGFTRQQRFELVGAEMSALLGWADDALVGRPAREIFAAEDEYDRLGALVGAAFAVGRPFYGEFQFRRRDGSTFWGRLQGRPVDAKDSSAGTIWLLEDVTERREVRERLSWSASHDGLTRLLNRPAFEEQLVAWLGHAAAQPRAKLQASLMFIDLDRFKQINDSAGHAAGDSVLRDVAQVLLAHVRSADAVARIGGDEFALLLPGCVAEVALQLAERLRRAVSAIGIAHAGQRLTVGASIGVVELDALAGASAADWLARADAACYDAKHAGRGTVRLAPAAALPLLSTSRQ